MVRQTDKILWRAYSMASVTPGDVVPKVDFIKFRGLLGSRGSSVLSSTARVSGCRLSKKGLFDNLPFGGKRSSGKPKPKKPAAGGNLKLLPNPFGGDDRGRAPPEPQRELHGF